jgi:hypothetical protein
MPWFFDLTFFVIIWADFPSTQPTLIDYNRVHLSEEKTWTAIPTDEYDKRYKIIGYI